jgi:hypothetical protein
MIQTGEEAGEEEAPPEAAEEGRVLAEEGDLVPAAAEAEEAVEAAEAEEVVEAAEAEEVAEAWAGRAGRAALSAA